MFPPVSPSYAPQSDGTRVPARHVQIVAGVMRVDRIFATATILSVDSDAVFCSAFLHGRGVTTDAPAHVQEAALLYALRTLREWVTAKGQRTLRHVDISASSAMVHFQADATCHLRRPPESSMICRTCRHIYVRLLLTNPQTSPVICGRGRTWVQMLPFFCLVENFPTVAIL